MLRRRRSSRWLMFSLGAVLLVMLGTVRLSLNLGLRDRTSTIFYSDPEDEDNVTNASNDSVTILLWSDPAWSGFGKDYWPLPNYLGEALQKPRCPADLVLFEPYAYGRSAEWRRHSALQLPEKRAWQEWVQFGYEQGEYFPLAKEPGFVSRLEINMTYQQNSGLPITFACPWGGGGLEVYREPPLPFAQKTGLVAFIASNCHAGGALARTRYVLELMKHIHVDSFGDCLRNAAVPPDVAAAVGFNLSAHYWADPGAGWRLKRALLRGYKFVLAFENNNLTDYVTEKAYNAWQAGAVPVYMGAPNIAEWAPAPDSYLATAAFASPAALAGHLLELSRDPARYEALLAWKQRPLSAAFLRKYRRCVFFAPECRLCHFALQRRRERGPELAALHAALKLQPDGRALLLDGRTTFARVPNGPRFNLTRDYSIAAWVQAFSFGDFRIVDKNRAGTITGFNLDLLKDADPNVAFLRFCGAGGCWNGYKPLQLRHWYHVGVSVTRSGIDLFVNGYLDGVNFKSGGSTLTNDFDVNIGRAATGGSMWHGLIDDVSIWSRPLSESDMRVVMGRKLTGREPGLLGYWPLDGAGGERGGLSLDLGPHGAHAHLHGEATFAPAALRPLITHQCQ